MKLRTKAFAVRVFRLCRSLPQRGDANIIANQLLRSSSSVSANYRAVCRARSKAEFIAKLGIVIEEIDESLHWLELLIATEIMQESKLSPLMDEASQLTAIFVASRETARGRRGKPINDQQSSIND